MPGTREPARPGTPRRDRLEGGTLVIFMIRRVLQALAVLLIVTVITFALLRLIPGNPAIAVMGPQAYRNPAAIAQFDRVYGFNRPW